MGFNQNVSVSAQVMQQINKKMHINIYIYSQDAHVKVVLLFELVKF